MLGSVFHDTQFETITINELQPCYAAEITGSHSINMPDLRLKDIKAAMNKVCLLTIVYTHSELKPHVVGNLVLRNANTSNDQHIAFSYTLTI